MAREKLPGLDVTIERDVDATMRDGTVLRADVFRPDTAAPLPVILVRGPYDKRIGTAAFGNSHPGWFAAHGYVVVVQDSRGRFASEGEFYPFLHEMDDGYDSVEWAAQLDGSDGRVAMMGFSYLGATQLLAAVRRPPSLATIVPAFTASQFYQGWTYRGGALSLAFVAYWANLLAMNTAERHGDLDALRELGTSLRTAPAWFPSLPLSDYPPLQERYAPYFYDWVRHPTYDDYWSRWSIDEDYGRVDVPAFHIGGWYDIFVSGTVKNYLGISAGGGSAESRRRQKLVLGPWLHMPWTPMGRTGCHGPSTNELDDWHIDWFDHVLKGKDNGVLDDPVTIYSVDGSRRDHRAWPPPEVEFEDWFVHSDGRANTKFGDGTLSRTGPGDEPPDSFVYSPTVPVASQGGHSCCFDSITPMGPADQHLAESSRMVLVYTSEPLAADLELAGDVTVTLYAASSAPDTDFTARLCVVDASGRSVNLQEGIVRARYRESLTAPSLLRPGQVYELTIDLGPVGAHVPAGSRVRLDISSSDFPQWDRNLNTGGVPGQEGVERAVPATQTVLHNRAHPTRVRLPVLRARSGAATGARPR